MKKVFLITILVLTMILTCSCVEKIAEETIPELGPIPTVPQPDKQEPIDGLDPDSIPDGTEDGTNPEDPDNEDGPENQGGNVTVPENGILFTQFETAQTSALAGYISNNDHSADGDVVKEFVSGNTTIYKVCYGRTITFVVEVTDMGSTLKVETFLEHYRFFMGNQKSVVLKVGDVVGSVVVPELEWDENTAAKTTLSSALVNKPDGDTVDIEVSMLFGGVYHDETIETLELSTTYSLN